MSDHPENDFQDLPLGNVEISFGNELPDEVLATLRLISKKWSLPLLYKLHESNWGFSDLKAEITQGSNPISSNMLSKALDELQSLKLIEKRIINDAPVRVEYSSTILGNWSFW